MPEKTIHKKVLIVDANLDGLLSFRNILSRAGFQIMTAANLQVAEELISVSQCDYVLMHVKDLTAETKAILASITQINHQKTTKKDNPSAASS